MSPHDFHIPVMGLGFTADTPLRVARFGIDSAVSIVEDGLLERLRAHYAPQYGMEYIPVPRSAPHRRSRRISLWLDLMADIIDRQMDEMRSQSFGTGSDKDRYFELLPDHHPLKSRYQALQSLPEGVERETLSAELTAAMIPGRIDTNIMVKLDAAPLGSDGKPDKNAETNALSALRGYAESRCEGAVVLSAGINKPLFGFISRFRGFYRDAEGRLPKKIILKVSDLRSSLIQGRYLAKKGLEVYEYRIESGLNCGGHAFATNGLTLASVVRDFSENRHRLQSDFDRGVRDFYEKKGWPYPERPARPRVTVQGGIGTAGENLRLLEDFGMDAVGWGTPFLFVPEATSVDRATRNLLASGGKDDYYLSHASPFGIPFNNIRGSGSDRFTKARAAAGKPGSPCRKRLLVSNTEFSEIPICTGSARYQKKKLAELNELNLSPRERKRREEAITARVCLCEHLCNSTLIERGIAEEGAAPQCICPGPNGQWFSRDYTLAEMVDHLYGRNPSLVPAERPHMLAAELTLYTDHLAGLLRDADDAPASRKALAVFRENLEAGIDLCADIARTPAHADENLASLARTARRERQRIASLFEAFDDRMDKLRLLEKGRTAAHAEDIPVPGDAAAAHSMA